MGYPWDMPMAIVREKRASDKMYCRCDCKQLPIVMVKNNRYDDYDQLRLNVMNDHHHRYDRFLYLPMPLILSFPFFHFFPEYHTILVHVGAVEAESYPCSWSCFLLTYDVTQEGIQPILLLS